MTDSSTPKGPRLPGSGELEPPKTTNKVIPIGSEKVTDSAKIKERKRAHRQEREKRKARRSASKTESPEQIKAKQEASQKKKLKEEQNDKRLKDKLRKKQRAFVKFVTHLLPKRNPSAGNNPSQLPRHPLTVKMTGMDPNVAADTVVNERSRNELALKHQHQKQLQNQAANTKAPPTFKPPGM